MSCFCDGYLDKTFLYICSINRLFLLYSWVSALSAVKLWYSSFVITIQKRSFILLKLKVCWCQVAMWVSSRFIHFFLFKSVFTICWCCFLFLKKIQRWYHLKRHKFISCLYWKSFWAIANYYWSWVWLFLLDSFHKQNHNVQKEFDRSQWSIRCNSYYCILWQLRNLEVLH